MRVVPRRIAAFEQPRRHRADRHDRHRALAEPAEGARCIARRICACLARLWRRNGCRGFSAAGGASASKEVPVADCRRTKTLPPPWRGRSAPARTPARPPPWSRIGSDNGGRAFRSRHPCRRARRRRRGFDFAGLSDGEPSGHGHARHCQICKTRPPRPRAWFGALCAGRHHHRRPHTPPYGNGCGRRGRTRLSSRLSVRCSQAERSRSAPSARDDRQ